jgi:hypothetical protein
MKLNHDYDRFIMRNENITNHMNTRTIISWNFVCNNNYVYSSWLWNVVAQKLKLHISITIEFNKMEFINISQTIDFFNV